MKRRFPPIKVKRVGRWQGIIDSRPIAGAFPVTEQEILGGNRRFIGGNRRFQRFASP